MVIKFPYFIILMLFVGHIVAAQTASPPIGENPNAELSSSSYVLEETEEGMRFIQRFDWQPIDTMIRYEFVLDKRSDMNSEYYDFLTESTDQAFVDVSLPAGNYRYKVLGYNILDRVGAESEYIYFDVIQAFQPIIAEILTKPIFSVERSFHRITLNGEHLSPESNIYLVPANKDTKNNSADQPGVLFPTEIIYSETGESAELIVDVKHASEDRFTVFAINPGGLSNSSEPITIKKFFRPGTLNLSVGYAPLIPFYPFDFFPFNYIDNDNHISTLLDKDFYPVGYTTRLSIVPWETRFGNFGIEFARFIDSVSTEKDAYTLSTNINGFTVSLLRQEPLLNNKLFVNLRLGGGIASFAGLQYTANNSTPSEPLTTTFPELQMGASLQYLFYKEAFVELGMDIKFLFASGMFTSYLSPTLTFGLQFFDNLIDDEIQYSQNPEPLKKPQNVRFSAGYAPIIPFYPFDFFPFNYIDNDNHLTNVIGKDFYPLGFSASIAFIASPSKPGSAHYGFEISPFMNSISAENDTYRLTTNLWGINLSLLRQEILLDGKLLVNTRLGGGIASFSDLQFEYEDDTTDLVSYIFPELQIGASVQYFVYKEFFVEFGMDIKFLFASGMFTSYISPALSIGLQF
jgi:hypothetical protein